MQEYKYVIYVGEGGWGCSDTAYFIQPNGVVKRVSNACVKGCLPSDMITEFEDKNVNHLQLELAQGDLSSIDTSFLKSIEKRPKRIIGFDGYEVSLYKAEKDKLKFIWMIEDYQQIDILNELNHVFFSIDKMKLADVLNDVENDAE